MIGITLYRKLPAYRAVVVVLILFSPTWLASCVTSPLDEQVLENRDETLDFLGYATSPGARITIKAFDHIHGQWDELADTMSGTHITSFEMYAWGLSTQIPQSYWKPVSFAENRITWQARVLASQDGGRTIVFDRDGIECMTDRLSELESFNDAIIVGIECGTGDVLTLSAYTESDTYPNVVWYDDYATAKWFGGNKKILYYVYDPSCPVCNDMNHAFFNSRIKEVMFQHYTAVKKEEGYHDEELCPATELSGSPNTCIFDDWSNLDQRITIIPGFPGTEGLLEELRRYANM